MNHSFNLKHGEKSGRRRKRAPSLPYTGRCYRFRSKDNRRRHNGGDILFEQRDRSRFVSRSNPRPTIWLGIENKTTYRSLFCPLPLRICWEFGRRLYGKRVVGIFVNG